MEPSTVAQPGFGTIGGMRALSALRLAASLGVLLAGACRSDTGGSRFVTVTVLGGDQPEPGAGVISHTASGDLVDQTVADAVGRAAIGVDDDSLITVVLPGMISASTPVISLVTTTAPPGDALSVIGPDRMGPPALIVGVLELDGPPLPAADYIAVDVGCATVNITKLPEIIDIGACSLGSDTAIDVLARGIDDPGGDPPAPMTIAYAAGRATMRDGHAVLALPAWQTDGTPIPVTLDGVTPILSWTQSADGVPFAEEVLPASPFAYANLAIDQTRLDASIVGTGFARITSRYVAGVPDTIAFSGDDFLPAFDLATEITSMSPLALRWDAAASDVDVVHLRAEWGALSAAVVPGSARILWDAVLPPEVTEVSLPALTGDLATTIGGTPDATNIVLRHIDSSELSDFAAAQAAGIHAEDTAQASTIVPRPASGQIRVAHTIGVR